ncbi:MAG: hypothetical protein RMY31_033440 [Dendronalium sp. ChiSLP03b]|nr:hypothetical protein [Dendronalium sp. ChiSLP03b]
MKVLILNPAFNALAIPARVVFSIDAQNLNSKGIDLKVWSGYGLTINFIPTGEVIKQVWIGDPSRIGFTSNGDLCSKSNSNNESSECTNTGATVLFLRQIKPVNFPHMTSSADGSTQITVITNGPDGHKQYQFKLIPATGQPAYTSLVIKPDSERPAPLLTARVQPAVTTKKSSATQQTLTPVKKQNVTVTSTPPALTLTIGNTLQRSDANALAYGLAIARQKEIIKPGSTNWRKAQDAIRLLRRGKSRDKALALSRMPSELFEKLINWGQTNSQFQERNSQL